MLKIGKNITVTTFLAVLPGHPSLFGTSLLPQTLRGGLDGHSSGHGQLDRLMDSAEPTEFSFPWEFEVKTQWPYLGIAGVGPMMEPTDEKTENLKKEKRADAHRGSGTGNRTPKNS